MTPEEYISDRLQDQIDWYDAKSAQNQKKFKRFRKIEIFTAALIPLLSGIAASKIDTQGIDINLLLLIIIGISGVVITIVSSIITLQKFQENWIEYRTICETLKKEKYSYQTGIKPYNKENSFQILVQRIESIISKENTNWANYTIESENKEKQ